MGGRVEVQGLCQQTGGLKSLLVKDLVRLCNAFCFYKGV